jgi:hypothetical protein
VFGDATSGEFLAFGVLGNRDSRNASLGHIKNFKFTTIIGFPAQIDSAIILMLTRNFNNVVFTLSNVGVCAA